jgi:hypothetical protein
VLVSDCMWLQKVARAWEESHGFLAVSGCKSLQVVVADCDWL